MVNIMKLNVLAGAILLSALPLTSFASALPNAPHVETSGLGTVDAKPDLAKLTIQVSVSSLKAADAKKQADERMVEYFAFLEGHGVTNQDINAANIRTYPEYDYSKGDGQPTIKGYKANRSITVTLRDLSKLNTLLDGALEAGLNEISNVELGVAEPSIYQEQAKQKAMENAKIQAQSLAEGMGAKLGPVYRISYQTINVPMPRPMYKAMAAMEADSPAVNETYQQETIKFSDQIEVVYELAR